MNGKHQAIKDWMINRKIPQILRPHIPILVIDDQIAMILWDRFFVSELFKMGGKNTQNCSILINFLFNE